MRLAVLAASQWSSAISSLLWGWIGAPGDSFIAVCVTIAVISTPIVTTLRALRSGSSVQIVGLPDWVNPPSSALQLEIETSLACTLLAWINVGLHGDRKASCAVLCCAVLCCAVLLRCNILYEFLLGWSIASLVWVYLPGLLCLLSFSFPLRWATLRYAALRCAALRCAVLCCAVLCCAVLCCVFLRCAVFCNAVLCRLYTEAPSYCCMLNGCTICVRLFYTYPWLCVPHRLCCS